MHPVNYVFMTCVLMITGFYAEDCPRSCREDTDSKLNQRLLRLEKELRTVVRRLEGLIDLEIQVKDLRESDSLQETWIEKLIYDDTFTDKNQSDPRSGSIFKRPEDGKRVNLKDMGPITRREAQSVLENISRTYFKDHLKEILQKVDTTIYENETRKLNGSLQRLDANLQATNGNIVSIQEDLKAMDNSIKLLNEAIKNNINYRLNTLETSAITEEKFKELENKVWHLSTSRELLEDQLAAVLHKTSDTEEELCEPPTSQNPHLQFEVKADSGGRKILRFGCEPIGRYALSSSPSLVSCQNGTWTGSFPKCSRLLNETEIYSISEEMKDEKPCEGRTGDFPDPSNCRRFFNCWNGRTTVIKCPSSLHFNEYTGKCDNPVDAKCSPVENTKVRELEDMVPPILFSPKNLDQMSSRETKNPGQLLVRQGTNFSLLCLFPDTPWGAPSWHVYYSQPYLLPPPPVIVKLNNSISLTVSAAKEEHTGIYTCQTPFGKEYRLPVLVRDINKSKWKCPPFYTRHVPDLILEKDEDQQTITFKCGGGLRLIGNAFTRCRDDGVWSHVTLPRCKP